MPYFVILVLIISLFSVIGFRHFSLYQISPRYLIKKSTGHLPYQYCFVSPLSLLLFMSLLYEPGSFIFLCLTHRHTKHILQHMYSTVSWILLSFVFLSSLFKICLWFKHVLTLVFLSQVSSSCDYRVFFLLCNYFIELKLILYSQQQRS